MAVDGSLIFDSRIDTSGFGRGTADIRKQLSGLSAAVKKLGLAIGSVFAVKKLVEFGKEAIELGSDLAEVQNVVDVTFTTMSDKVNEFAKNAAVSAGLSETMAKQYVGTFGAMSKSFGFAEKDAYEMSSSLTQLAGDVASFYNISQDESYIKLKSVFTGETESLKDLGVVMTQSALDAYALANGFGKVTSEMTEQEKVALRYKFVMDQLSLASGDFARTSDGWANQVRILKLQFDSLKATLGQGLINIFTPVLKMINALIGRLTVLASSFKAFTELLTGNKSSGGDGISAPSADGYNEAAEGAENLANATQDAKEETKKAKKEAEGYLSPIDEINKMKKDTGGENGSTNSPSTGLGVDYGSLAEGETVIDKLDEKLLKLKEVLAGLIKPFKDAWAAEGAPTIEAIQYAFSSLGELAKSIGSSFYEVWTNGTGTQTLQLVLQIVQNIFNTIGAIAEKLNEAWNTNNLGTSIIQNIFNLLNIILSTVEKISRATAEWAKTLDFTPLLTSVNGLLAALEPLAQNIGDGLVWFYENALLPIAGWTIQEAVPAFLDLLTAAIGAVNEAINALEPAGQWLWDNFLQPLGEWAGDTVIEALRTLTGLLEDLGSWIGEHQVGFQAITITLLTFFFFFKSIGAITSFIAILSKLKASISVLASGGILSGVGALGKLVNAFALAAGGAGTLHEAFVAIFGSVGTVFAGIGSVITGVVTAVVNFFAMLKDGFSWINEILMVLGIALAAVGAVILGAPAAVAAVVAGIVAAVATLVVAIKDNWDAICAFFSGAAEWFNTNVIQPIVDFFIGLWESVSGFFSDLWQEIQDIWKGVSEWFDTNVVEPVVGFFQGLHERVSQIFEGLWIIVQAIWKIVSEWFNTNVIQPIVGFFKGLWESVSGFFSSLWTDVQNVWKAVSGWFKANVTDPVTGFFKGVWTSVSGFFSDLWKGIQNVWKSVAGWFSKTVIDPIKNAWKTATDAVGGFFTGLWHGIANGVVSAMNSVIGSIESGINFIVGGINSILSGFNSVVSWAASIVGVDWSGVSLVPSVYLTRIPLPYLASGAVIPPNAPFAAVLGDQKRGRNLEAPESLIRKIVREESGKGAGSGNTYHVHVNVSGRELLEIVLNEGELKRGRNGGNPFMLGVT